MNLDSAYDISVILVTYNHEKFIETAIRSILNQNFEGRVELIVADDSSKDGTLDIIRKYENTDSRFDFVYMDSSVNLGIMKNYKRSLESCRGTYIAILEGDDYWCSPDKLKMQSEFLDKHFESDVCVTNCFLLYEINSSLVPRKRRGSGYRLYNTSDLIDDNFICSFTNCMYRYAALEKIPVEIFDHKAYDWIFGIVLSKNTLIGYLKEPMSVYRIHAKGTWSNKSAAEKIEEQLGVIDIYDRLTNMNYTTDFAKLKFRLMTQLKVEKIRAGQLFIRPDKQMLKNAAKFIMPPVVWSLLKLLCPPFVIKIFNKGKN